MSPFIELPVEIFIDKLLPLLPVLDIAHLSQTSKFFNAVCADETFWRRRLQSDFNFSGIDTARTTGFKFIYQRLTKPQVYVWGEKSHGRLGLSQFPRSTVPDVPFPTKLTIKNAKIVSLVAGGMSFHALDSEGRVFVWGTLDGTTFTLHSDGFSESGKPAHTPLMLQLPTPIRGISCGRLHSAFLDSRGQVWCLLSWGRPFRLTSPVLGLPGDPIVQVECGWSFIAALTRSGEIFVWWPFGGDLLPIITQKNEALDATGDKKAYETRDGCIPCVVSDLSADPFRLPSLPQLPNLDDDAVATPEVHITQIGGLDEQIIALTSHGHVLKFQDLQDITSASSGSWHYLPNFSELKQVQQLPQFASEGASLTPPDTLKVNHISAHFMNFTAYATGSSSTVLIGNTETSSEAVPKIIPELQNQSVISVVLGDYHNAAVTSTGRLLTWGAYSKGALGLGDPVKVPVGSPGGFASENERLMAEGRNRGTPPDVRTPAEVKFSHGLKNPRSKFCVSATAAGWHTGALVIDLEDDNKEEEVEMEEPPEARSQLPLPIRGPGRGRWESPPILPTHNPLGVQLPFQEAGDPPMFGPGGGIFRVGFAGRGMGRGGRGRGQGSSGGASNLPPTE